MVETHTSYAKQDGNQAVARIFTTETSVSLPPQQRKVAELIAKHPEKIVFGNLRSIAAWTGVSTLTILRLAKSLGFKGYHALQLAAREAYFERKDNEDRSEHTSAVTNILREQLADIKEVGTRVRPEEIEEVCHVLLKARRVYICATDPAMTLARVLARRLFFAGVSSEVLTPSDLFLHFATREPHQKDVFIGVHLWLVFLDIYRVIEFAKEKGAQTIVFAGSPISPLLKISDHYLYAHTETGRPYSSWVPLMALFEIVTARLIERNPDAAKAIYKTFREQADMEHLAVKNDAVKRRIAQDTKAK